MIKDWLAFQLCPPRECVLDCNRRGTYINGVCECEPIYAGVDCSIDLLKQSMDELLDGIDLHYNMSLIMNRADINGTQFDLP